ncbi:hypothetical protein MJ257_16765 [Paenibacillus timonensis]|uniref:Uncharacterized protein n=2 Tax=Paenibacillus timonensis TaxID=225915 RepID=A0ABW3SEG1_9BACL|nr:hypothetical protein [Paenibacillus timonensis]
MDMAAITSITSVLAAISGIALGWAGRSKATRQEAEDVAEAEAIRKTEIVNITRLVDDMKVEQKLQGQRFEAFSERLTRVEESAKQAHKRIDRLEE